DVERWEKASTVFTVGHAVSCIGAREATAPHSKVETTLANLIHCRRFLGEPHRMAQWQDADTGADPHALGARRNGGSQNEGHGSDRRDAPAHRICRAPGASKMALGQPHSVYPVLFGDVDNREGLGKGLLLCPPITIVTFHNQADVHAHLPRAFVRPPMSAVSAA